MDVVIEPAVLEDAAALLEVQRAAFTIEARLYGDPAIPPLLETVADVAAAIAAGEVLVARLEGRLVGSVRRVLTGDDVEVGRLSVLPELQGRGLGSRLLAAAEDVPGAATASLFTGHLSEGNLGLYRRRGYQEFDRRQVSPEVALVYLRKSLPALNR
jgi:ribosomal protein S18 acetylase RimI-like enzyme